MIKAVTTFLLIVACVFLAAGTANAVAANPSHAQNPQTVAFYPGGTHTVIQHDGSIAYGQPGADLVTRAGNSGNFQQFYASPEGEQVHTLFRNVGSDTSCNGHALFLENPYQPPTGDTWGYYFPDGDNYCATSSH